MAAPRDAEAEITEPRLADAVTEVAAPRDAEADVIGLRVADAETTEPRLADAVTDVAAPRVADAEAGLLDAITDAATLLDIDEDKGDAEPRTAAEDGDIAIITSADCVAVGDDEPPGNPEPEELDGRTLGDIIPVYAGDEPPPPPVPCETTNVPNAINSRLRNDSILNLVGNLVIYAKLNFSKTKN